MRVAVVGCGYVGLVSGVGLASVGHEVIGIEVDDGRRERIAAGGAPFHEPGLPELLRSELEHGSLRVTPDLDEATNADVVLLAVQTPPKPDGSVDLSYLESAASALADAFASAGDRDRVVAVRSTVVPGTAERLLSPIFGQAASVASNPEFLREGSAVQDFLRPDRVLVGCHEEWARERLAELYRPLHSEVIFTSPATAELAKYASNAFLATLVSFSNEIGRICESLPGVDVEDVLGVIHEDRRLGDGDGEPPEILSYLKAGCGFGGSCLPKDLSALIAAGEAEGEELPLLRGVRAVNEAQPSRVVAVTREALGGLERRTVAVLGLAFKAGTDDLRESPSLKIIGELLDEGVAVRAYDPLVGRDALEPYISNGQVEVAESLEQALADADACVVTTNAPEVAALGERLAGGGHADLVVVDGRRILDPEGVGDDAYVGVGRARLYSLSSFLVEHFEFVPALAA